MVPHYAVIKSERQVAMKQPLYIGVTGFMTPQEVRAGLDCLTLLQSRKLMVGVLASSKTILGEKNKYPNRYPEVQRINQIFQPHPSALNLIHYATDQPESLSKQLLCLVEFTEPTMHGFQLNVAWPHIGELEKFHEATKWKYRLVLQVGGRAMERVENNPVKLADMIGKYAGSVRMVDDILIDSSGGKGQPFDIEKALSYLREIKSRNFEVNLGLAGGLGPNSMKRIEPILDEFPGLNLDAEGRLRDEQSDDLDIGRMTAYLLETQVWLSHS
jgi:phosphoribosylanthranilate isomerase